MYKNLIAHTFAQMFLTALNKRMNKKHSYKAPSFLGKWDTALWQVVSLLKRSLAITLICAFAGGKMNFCERLYVQLKLCCCKVPRGIARPLMEQKNYSLKCVGGGREGGEGWTEGGMEGRK